MTKTLSIDIEFDGSILGYDLGKLLREQFESQLIDLVSEEIKNFKTGTRSVTNGSISLSSATYLNPLKDEKTL